VTGFTVDQSGMGYVPDALNSLIDNKEVIVMFGNDSNHIAAPAAHKVKTEPELPGCSVRGDGTG
jgi:hypothetical protein